MLTLEHAFGRVPGRPALLAEIGESESSAAFLLISELNIQRHELEMSKRTSLFEIFGESDEFADLEVLLEKCTRADRKRRPRNAIKLREELVLAEFLQRIENGERPSEIVPTRVDKLKREFPVLREFCKRIFSK